MAETNLPVTGGSGYNVAGYTDSSSNFVQSIGVADYVTGSPSNVLVAGTAQATANAIPVASVGQSVSFTTTTVQSVGSTDAGNYRWVSVQIATQGGSSTVAFQGSNDNSNWLSVGLELTTSAGTTTNPIVTNTTTTGIYHGYLPTRYFRINVTGIASGTTAGTIWFSSTPGAFQTISVTAQEGGTWNVGSNTATGSAFPANAFGQGYTDGTNLVAARTPSIFKTGVFTSSGNNALWTPTASKKFVIMRYLISVTANAATSGGGLLEVTFQDSSTAMSVGALSVFCPSATCAAG